MVCFKIYSIFSNQHHSILKRSKVYSLFFVIKYLVALYGYNFIRYDKFYNNKKIIKYFYNSHVINFFL